MDLNDSPCDDLRGAAAFLLRYASMTWAAGQLDLARRLVGRAQDLLQHAARAGQPRAA